MTNLTQDMYHYYSNCDISSYREILLNAVYDNDIEILDCLLTKNEHRKVISINDTEAFVEACRYNRLDIVHYLLTSTDIEATDLTRYGKRGLEWACAYGNLDILKFLLTIQELNENITNYLPELFESAVNNESVTVMRYLYDLYALKGHRVIRNPSTLFNYALSISAYDMAAYLLSLKEFKKVKIKNNVLTKAIKNKKANFVYTVLCFSEKNDIVFHTKNKDKIAHYFITEHLDYYIKMCEHYDMTSQKACDVRDLLF